MTQNVTRACSQQRQACVRRSGAWLLFLLLLMPWPAMAVSDVLVVLTEGSAAQSEVLASMRAGLSEALDRKVTLRTITTADVADLAAQAGPRRLPDLVVTVGTDAARVVLAQQFPVPVYCTFLPEAAYDALLPTPTPGTAADRARHSALYIDQPFIRQMQLLHLALPQRTRIGVVLGPESRESEPALQRAAAAAGLMLRVEEITEEKQLIQALYRVMEEADVLLAVPDPLVFNRHTAQDVLLTTYRLGKPVAGYSRAYVSAGALLAVYSTPAQIGRQVGETLRALSDRPGRSLPTPQHPRYFSVEVNERVARSLGLNVENADVLVRKLAEDQVGRNP